MNLVDIYTKARTESEKIEGAHSPVSTAIFVYYCSLLPATHNALEIGVWNGKSASVLAQIFDNLDLVDVAEPKCLPQIRDSSGANIQFMKEWSHIYLEKALDGEKRYNFIHMDTSHSFKDTLAELNGVSMIASNDAILVLDDWNEIYPTVQAGYYNYRFACLGIYEVFLVAYNKAYLCHPAYFEYYASRVDALRSFLASCGYKTHIARTSNVPEYRAFLVRPETPNVEEYYGGYTFENYDLIKSHIELPGH